MQGYTRWCHEHVQGLTSELLHVESDGGHDVGVLVLLALEVVQQCGFTWAQLELQHISGTAM